MKCLDKVTLAMSNRQNGSADTTNDDMQHKKLISKQGDRMFFVDIDDICYFNSSQGSVVAHTQNKAYPIAMSMEKLAQTLPANDFVRFHRSFVINVNYIKALNFWSLCQIMTRLKLLAVEMVLVSLSDNSTCNNRHLLAIPPTEAC